MNKDNHLIFESYFNKFFKTNTLENENAGDAHGVDPKDAAEYDKARAEISYEKYPFWDAYHAVKEGAWTEEDFVQWARSVWSDGANDAHHEGEEVSETKHVFTKVEKAAEKSGYSKKAAEKIAGAAKAKYGEDNESSPAGWLTEYIGSFKRAFADVEGIGYGGDGVSDEQFAAAADQIIGPEWGDEAPKAKQAFIYLLKGFYGKGIQDS